MSDSRRYSQKHASSEPTRLQKTIKTVFKVLFLLIFIITLAVCGYVAKCIHDAPEIEPSEIYDSIAQNSYIYDDKGNKIDTLCGSENRKIVRYDELPENLVNAFVAIEDKTFWEHHGFNLKRMAGAVIHSVLTGDPVSGTSTITQQLARNVYLPTIKSDRSITRKITEMYYAYRIEKELDKETIAEAYLNSIYLGYGCYGVASAADTYFSKRNIENLSLAQCAALAALPQAPDSYALLKTESSEYTREISKGLYANDISKGRRELVLDLMSEQGYITRDEAEEAKGKSIENIIKPNTTSSDSNASYSYFTDYLVGIVISDLQKRNGLSEEEATSLVYSGGIKIYSTLNTETQKIVATEFKKSSNFPYAAGNADVEAAMVITENGTGRIKAMMGGRDPKGKRLYNRAISPRQPGSSIKPLTVYSAALQKSLELEENGDKYIYNEYGKEMGDYITTSSSVTDSAMRFNGSEWPKNATRSYSGKNTFCTAIQQSINTCAVKILMQVDVEYAMEQLKRFGITTAVDDTTKSVNDLNLAALALGAMTEGCTPLEMSLAYGTFVNKGYVNKPVCYTKVVDSDGYVILEEDIQSTKVMDEGVAWIMRDVLQSVVSKGIAKGASISGVSVGGKTGTTDACYDIWFDGFTPKYSAALWIGTDKNKSLSTMSGPAALLWSRIMRQIPGVTEGEYSGMPDNVIKSGSYYYTEGTSPEKPVYSGTKVKTSDKSDDKPKSSTSSSGGSSNSNNTDSKSGKKPLSEEEQKAFENLRNN